MPSHPWQMALPALHGVLVTLREVAPGDGEHLAGLLPALDGARFGRSASAPLSFDDFSTDSDCNRREGRGFAYAICPLASNTPVGLVQVRLLPPGVEAAEWAFAVQPEWHGCGIFSEAAELVAGFTFGVVGLHRLEARVPVNNGRAQGALRKLGAAQEGVLRRSLRVGHEYVDQVLWSLLSDDWRPRTHPTGDPGRVQ